MSYKCSLILLLVVISTVTATRKDPNFQEGRTAIVHLFEWKWTDIVRECEEYLGPHQFAGVQISPPMEHRVYPEFGYPWWQRYQPVSYRIDGRSGGREAFADMVSRCNDVGVRVYVDAIVNHMASVNSTANDTYNFPDVPFTPQDFNVPKGLCNLTSGDIAQTSYVYSSYEVRYCNLLSLADIYYGPDNDNYGKTKVLEYLNDLISMGVAGFRIDAAKHMPPEILSDILDGLDDCTFGGSPWVYNEVIDVNEAEAIRSSEYFECGDVTEFRYCDAITLLGRGIKNANEYEDFGFDDKWGLMPDENAVVFVENHDNQRNHGAGGDILAFKEPLPYKKAVAFTLAWPYGTKRLMSSYEFENSDQGPPSNENGEIDDVVINSRGLCDGGWVCEHRWHEVRNMVCFQNIVEDEQVENWWDNGNNAIAFSRGDKGFFALNNEEITVTEVLQTGLPEGQYCDLISGDPTTDGCSGRIVEVSADGTAEITLIPSGRHGDDAILALTKEATFGRGNYEGCLFVGAGTRLVPSLTWISILLAFLFLKWA
ncbi:alpha-amylase-like [Lytechinus pictus]|uniref:alpha-amylase-like n=1 Tax=Lytechinus pictus TaxID=7653 RepID=UPI0030B9B67B